MIVQIMFSKVGVMETDSVQNLNGWELLLLVLELVVNNTLPPIERHVLTFTIFQLKIAAHVEKAKVT